MKHTIKKQQCIIAQIKNVMMCDQKILENNTGLL